MSQECPLPQFAQINVHPNHHLFWFILSLSSLSARAREGLLPGLQPDGPRVRRQAEPGDVAGRVAVRTQRPGGIEKSASDCERSAQRPHSDRSGEDASVSRA